MILVLEVLGAWLVLSVIAASVFHLFIKGSRA